MLLLYIFATFWYGVIYLSKLNQILLYGSAFIVGYGLTYLLTDNTDKIAGDECKCDLDFMNDRFDYYESINCVIPLENAGRDLLNCLIDSNTNLKFIAINPEKNPLPWLKDTDGTYLSLDGYLDLSENSELPKGVAYEYNGAGHYKCMNGNLYKYYKERYNDIAKKRILKQNNIPLIVLHTKIPNDTLWLKSRLLDALDSLNVGNILSCRDDIVANYIKENDKRYAEPKMQYINDISKITNMNRGQNGSFKIGNDIWTSKTHSSRKKKQEYDRKKEISYSVNTHQSTEIVHT